MDSAAPPCLLGVINLSPESMVTESIAFAQEDILARAAWLKAEGCSIIDLGARSITPTAPKVSESEEQRRLVPPLRLLVRNGYKVSVDTWSSNTVLVALANGACIINFTGSLISTEALTAIAAARAGLIITYMPYGDAYQMRDAKPVPYRIESIMAHLQSRIRQAQAAGIEDVIIDPNLGIIHPSTSDHAKIQLQNSILWNLDRLRGLGCPILLYAARKPEPLARLLFASNVLHSRPDYIRTHHPDLLNQLMSVNDHDDWD